MSKNEEVIPWGKLIDVLVAYQLRRVQRNDPIRYFEKKAAAHLDELLKAVLGPPKAQYCSVRHIRAWVVLQDYCVRYAMSYLKKHGSPPVRKTT
jgi:hypothetical protein